MKILSRLSRHKWRYTIATAALASVAILALAQAGTAHATVFNTMRPSGNTAYCVSDQGGINASLTLGDPCIGGNQARWGVEVSGYGGQGLYVQIENESTMLCMQTQGGGAKLGAGTCNGDRAQAWLELDGDNNAGWESAEVDEAHGIDYCADANATYGIRAEDCNGTGAQVWDGPE